MRMAGVLYSCLALSVNLPMWQAMGSAQLQEVAEKLPLEAAKRLYRMFGDDEVWALIQVRTACSQQPCSSMPHGRGSRPQASSWG